MTSPSISRLLMIFAVGCVTGVAAGQNFTAGAPSLTHSASVAPPVTIASAGSEYHQPEYLGVYRPDGRFRAVSHPGTEWPRMLDEPADQDTQREVPPGFRLHSNEAVVENFEPPARATQALPKQSLLVTLRDNIVTFAYGHERIFRTPTHVTTDSKGRLIISDPGLAAVHVLDPNGKASFRIVGGDQRRLRAPVGIAVDRNDNIYVADGKLGLIAVFNLSGQFLRFLGINHGESMFDSPTAIAIDQQSNRLYVLDTTASELVVLDLQGNVVKRAGGPRALNGVKLDYPSEIAIRNQEVAVLDGYGSRLQVLNLDCMPLRSFDLRNVGGPPVRGEVGLAIDDLSNIYVSNLLSPTIHVYDKNGRSLGFMGPHDSPQYFNLPVGMWVDSEDRLFVSNGARAQVQVFQISNGSDEVPTPALR